MMLHVTGRTMIAKVLLGHRGPQLHPAPEDLCFSLAFCLGLCGPSSFLLFLVSELLCSNEPLTGYIKSFRARCTI